MTITVWSRMYDTVGKFAFNCLRKTGWMEVCLNCLNRSDKYLPKGMRFRMVGLLPDWFGAYRCKYCRRMVRYRKRMLMSYATPWYNIAEKPWYKSPPLQ